MTTTPDIDWTRFDAMSESERRAAASDDPDAVPLTPSAMGQMRRTPQVRIIRRALGLSQEAFSTRFHIPLGTLRDWEECRKDPDAAARAYLVVIGRDPEAVSRALGASTLTARIVATASAAVPSPRVICGCVTRPTKIAEIPDLSRSEVDRTKPLL